MRLLFPIALGVALVSSCSSTSEKSEARASAEKSAAAPARDPALASRSFEFVYKASVDEVPIGAKQVRLWIPVPVDTPDQTISDVRVDVQPPQPYTIEPVQNGVGKALCVTSKGEPFKVEVRFDGTRWETHGGGQATKAELQRDLEADKFVPLGGKVSTIAASIPDGTNTVATSRELYDWTLDHMRYDKPDGGAWGRGDSEWACEAGYGNCTDFHSYFMGLARTKQIPARFEIGFSLPTGAEKVQPVKGYHCWAYFWDQSNGWVPVDISEADKDPAKTDYFFGTLDQNRVTLSGGRDLVLIPTPKKGALNFFIYPYAEADGVEVTKLSRSFEVLAR